MVNDDFNLEDFKWYRDTRTHRRCLATFVSDEDAERLGKKSGLWSMFGKGMLLGILHVASTNQWIVLNVDLRNNKPKTIESKNNACFERRYKLMNKQDL